MSGIAFLLLPGAGMSRWLWEPLIPLLEAPAVVVSPRLVPNTRDQRLHATFDQVLRHHEEAMALSGADSFVVVGHSGAGLVAGTLGKRNRKVKHVVFVAANIPRSGATALDVFPDEVRDRNIAAVTTQAEHDAIPLKALEGMFVPVFCNTCTPEQTQYVLSQSFFPEPVCAVTTRMNWDDYPPIGLSYVVCQRDKTLTVDQQYHLAAHLGIRHLPEIDSGHLPMISHKEELARILNGVLSGGAP